MTTTNENHTKKKPDFYIFAFDIEGKMKRIGVVFRHKKGQGFNILTGETRYVAFPPDAAFSKEGE